MPALLRFQTQVAQLKHLVFSAQTGPRSQTGWVGHARAQLSISHAQEAQNSVSRIVEKGQFQLASTGRILPFSNIFKLVWLPEKVAFYHERFGPHRPVWLFDLVAKSDTLLASQCPHHCGDDDYQVQVQLLPHAIVMSWQITGPRKDEHLHYQYFTDLPALP